MITDPVPLPLGWRESTLGDVTSLIRGVSYSKEQASLQPGKGLLPIVRATNIQDKLNFDDLVYVTKSQISETQILRSGDIVIAASSGSKKIVGKAAQIHADWQGSFGAFCLGIRPNSEIDAKYLGHFLTTKEYRTQVSNLAAGSNINNLKRQHVSNICIRLAPIDEQARIVAKIEELLSDLDAGIASLERARAKLKRYRASVLKSAVEGRLTQDWRAKNSPKESGAALLKRILKARREKWEAAQRRKFADAGKAPPKDWKEKYPKPAIPEAEHQIPSPEGWGWATVGQLTEVGTGTTPLRTEASYWSSGDIPWVTSSAVNEDVVTLPSDFVTAKAMEKTTLKLYPPGTLLLAMYGEGKTRGKVSELRITATINQALAALQFDETSAQVRDYLRVFLHGNYEQMRRLSSGGVQPNLNAGLVQRICLPLPSVAEQRKIVNQAEAALSSIARAESDIEAQLARGALLKQAILKRAFEGRLV